MILWNEFAVMLNHFYGIIVLGDDVGAPLAAPGFDPLVLVVRASQAGRGKQRPYVG